MENALNDKILRAHADGSANKLAELYSKAGDAMEAKGNIDAACFFFTHARVFALEHGLEIEAAIHKKLIHYGRDQ